MITDCHHGKVPEGLRRPRVSGVTPARLGLLLGTPPVPQGSWEREAVMVSAAALRAARGRPPREVAEEIAQGLRGRDGVAGVRVRPNAFLEIVLAVPGEIAREIVTAGHPGTPRVPLPDWPDFPRTWENPGFVVRFAHARAAAVLRWAGDLGVPWEGFRPEALDDPRDLAVLRALAELPSRTAGRDPAWESYAERLALAFHDACEHASALPMGDRPPGEVHTARVWLARAVQAVLVALYGDLPSRL
jgi:arginyl-tRNA synthetase